MKRTIHCLVVALLLSACSSAATDETGGPTASADDAAATTTTEPDTGGCVACHTDEAALRVLAVEPPDTETLSEGEG